MHSVRQVGTAIAGKTQEAHKQLLLAKARVDASAATVCKRVKQMATVAVVLKEGLKVAVTKGPRIACAGTTFAAGLNSLYNLDLTQGTILTAFGASELIKTLAGDDPRNEILGLLKDADAGLDMVKVLNEANRQSCKKIDGNLTNVKSNLEQIEQQLGQIKDLATNGNIELAKEKAEALDKLTKANDLFAKAQKAFQESKEFVDTSNCLFAKVLSGFADLRGLAHQEKGTLQERLDQFIGLSKTMGEECEIAQASLVISSESLTEGLTILGSAMLAQAEAAQAVGRTMAKAESVLKEVELKSQMEDFVIICHQEVDQAKAEVKVIEARLDDQDEIIGRLHEENEQMQDLVEAQWGTASVILGFATATTIASVMGPIAGAAAVAPATAIAHNRNRIIHTVGDAVFGKAPEVMPAAPTVVEKITFIFNSVSSGLWGYIRGKGSSTVGKVSINVGDETLTFKFNLNKTERISRRDQVELQNVLRKKLKEGKLTSQECLEILDQLKNYQIQREAAPWSLTNRKRVLTGFLTKKDDLWYKELKRECSKAS